VAKSLLQQQQQEQQSKSETLVALQGNVGKNQSTAINAFVLVLSNHFCAPSSSSTAALSAKNSLYSLQSSLFFMLLASSCQ
jgi:hypothetical protein